MTVPPEQEIRNMAELRRREKMEDKAAKAGKKKTEKMFLHHQQSGGCYREIKMFTGSLMSTIHLKNIAWVLLLGLAYGTHKPTYFWPRYYCMGEVRVN